jgi:hypothetical protein
MKSSLSAFETESQSIALPGYRWITFTVHKANQPLNAPSARSVVEILFGDPAFIDEYLNFALESEVAHGPYLLGKISPSDFVEFPFPLGCHSVLSAVMSGTGVYEGGAPTPDQDTIAKVRNFLAEIPCSSAYFFLQLDPAKNIESLSETGYILCEYSQHLLVSPALDQVFSFTVGCD